MKVRDERIFSNINNNIQEIQNIITVNGLNEFYGIYITPRFNHHGTYLSLSLMSTDLLYLEGVNFLSGLDKVKRYKSHNEAELCFEYQFTNGPSCIPPSTTVYNGIPFKLEIQFYSRKNSLRNSRNDSLISGAVFGAASSACFIVSAYIPSVFIQMMVLGSIFVMVALPVFALAIYKHKKLKDLEDLLSSKKDVISNISKRTMELFNKENSLAFAPTQAELDEFNALTTSTPTPDI